MMNLISIDFKTKCAKKKILGYAMKSMENGDSVAFLMEFRKIEGDVTN